MAAAAKPRPTTVYLDPKLARAIKIKAAMTERSVSQLINEAVRAKLKLDEDDLKYVRKHRNERARPLEEFLAEMKRNGDL
jgi:predicted transcriptional regulator